jgi:D-galactose 1-dehydrogenase
LRIKLGLVGAGKIANTQHLPTILSSARFELAAIADPSHTVPGVASYKSLEEMLAARPDIGALAICTPPQIRHQIARAAILAGKHVLLEKPPCATLNELDDLKALAREQRVSLFTAWHSRFAPAVAAARNWLHSRHGLGVTVRWYEDVRVWHPGQDWIWQPGGLGCFDAGINALSILTSIMPSRFYLKAAELCFPSNRQAPISAALTFVTDEGASVAAGFDFTGRQPQTWSIEAGGMVLSEGGARLEIDGKTEIDQKPDEYAGIYAKFAELIFEGASDVDGRPLKHVADAFMLGKRVAVAAWE